MGIISSVEDMMLVRILPMITVYKHGVCVCLRVYVCVAHEIHVYGRKGNCALKLTHVTGSRIARLAEKNFFFPNFL